MTGVNHGLTGAVIAVTVKKPELAIPLAFLSHFAQDLIPHWDYGTGKNHDKLFSRRFNTFLAADFILALIIMAFLGGAFPEQKWLIWACMAAAASPDLLWGYYYLYLEKIKKRKVRLNKLSALIVRIEWSMGAPGIIVELAWFIGFGYLILSLR
jgi:hypothetical protein